MQPTIIDHETGEVVEDTALANINEANFLLDEARDIADVKNITDTAAAFRVLLRRRDASYQAQFAANELWLKAERKMGELLKVMPKAVGGQPYRSTPSTVEGVEPTLADLGVDYKQSHRAQRLADIPRPVFEQKIEEARVKHEQPTMSDLLKIANHIGGQQRRASHAAQRTETPTRPTITRASWDAWLPEQPDCDLLLTDPPYATDVDDIHAFAAAWLPVALATVKRSGRAYVCIGAYPDELAAYLAADRQHMTLAQVLVWTYRNATNRQPTYDYILNWQAILYFRGPDAPALDAPDTVEQFAVQDISAPDARRDERYHTWQKPDMLAERLIRHSTKSGDLVLDPFAGTGTFVLAATRLGRTGRGCDIDDAMLTIAEERGCNLE